MLAHTAQGKGHKQLLCVDLAAPGFLVGGDSHRKGLLLEAAGSFHPFPQGQFLMTLKMDLLLAQLERLVTPP